MHKETKINNVLQTPTVCINTTFLDAVNRALGFMHN